MNIDWSKAPEWAKAHGVGGGCTMWVGDDRYAYTKQPLRTYCWAVRADNPGYRHRSELTSLIERPAAWTGEGLPPIGTVCEFATYHGGDPVWKECKIIAHDDGFAVIAYKGNYSEQSNNHLRPIRTQEQIAAEQREEKAKAMWQQIYFNTDPDYWDHAPEGTRDTFRHAIDAGWQKVPQ